MKTKLFFLFVFVSICSLLFSTIWEINLDGTGDFTSIQEGINASVDADTVIVYPGRYYENINYNGKSITVCSLEMITGDESYIATTIIDGNQQGSCVHFINEEDGAVLQGLSITNGSGTILYGDIKRLGGGIVVYTPINHPSPNVSIRNCRIFKNSAVGGGGMRIQRSNVELSGVNIYNNQAVTGGGIYVLYESTLLFDPDNLCNLYNNFSGNRLDLFVSDAVNDVDVIVDTFTVDSDFKYYAYYTHSIASTGELTIEFQNHFLDRINHDLYVSTLGDDSNDGLTPNTPLKTIAIALQRIESDSLNPKTVHVAAGTYSQALNNQIFPLAGKKCVSLIGENMENTILLNDYCEMSYLTGEDHTLLKNLTFTSLDQIMMDVINIFQCNDVGFSNIIVKDNFLDSNFSIDMYLCYEVLIDKLFVIDNYSEKGSGFSLDGGNAIIKNSVFDNNDALGPNQFVSNFYSMTDDYLELENCVFTNSDIPPFPMEENYTVQIGARPNCSPDIKISNCLFTNNYTPNGNYVVFVKSPGSVEMNNNTFTQNTSQTCPLGLFGEVEFNNNVLYNNTSDYEYEINTGNWPDITSTLNVCYSDIEGGEAAIYPGNPPNLATINWLDGNIDSDPLFLLSGEHPYQLTEFSPCVDSGTPNITGLYLPNHDLLFNQRVWDGDNNGEAIIDMGCYEFGADSVGVSNYQLPVTSSQMSNYPNPFNPSTTIYFKTTNLHESARIEIYNLKGQKVRTLPVILSDSQNRIEGSGTPNSYSVVWNGTDANNKPVSSGIYFARLRAGKGVISRKMLLLK